MDALSEAEQAHLAACGVPDEMVEQLEFLIDEIGGAVVAEGWQDPAVQASFVADRLEYCVNTLRKCAYKESSRKRHAKLADAYNILQELCGFKVGDHVKLLRRAVQYELGWQDPWPTQADKFVGQIGQVQSITGGVKVIFPEEHDGAYYPWFVLEKMED